MEIAMYGHFGFSLLLLPTAAADYLEYERFHLIESITPYINNGKIRAFSINSINSESWLDRQVVDISPPQTGVESIRPGALARPT